MSEALTLPDTGELNRRILVRLWTDVPNASFGVDQSFDAGITLWAKVEPVRGVATRMAMATLEEPTHSFWVRFSFSMPAEYYAQNRVIEYRGRRFRILDAQNFQDANRFVRITAKDLGAIDPADTDFAATPTEPGASAPTVYVPGLGV
jgi:SPP1 family predicted phage head-tail adaptor